jgi:hypothetical protein
MKSHAPRRNRRHTSAPRQIERFRQDAFVVDMVELDE